MIAIAFDNNKRLVAISQSLLKSKNMQASLIEITPIVNPKFN